MIGTVIRALPDNGPIRPRTGRSLPERVSMKHISTRTGWRRVRKTKAPKSVIAKKVKRQQT